MPEPKLKNQQQQQQVECEGNKWGETRLWVTEKEFIFNGSPYPWLCRRPRRLVRFTRTHIRVLRVRFYFLFIIMTVFFFVVRASHSTMMMISLFVGLQSRLLSFVTHRLSSIEAPSEWAATAHTHTHRDEWSPFSGLSATVLLPSHTGTLNSGQEQVTDTHPNGLDPKLYTS